jgi:ketosteroid isomerase-like protein
MRDILEACAEAAVAGDADRLRRLIHEDGTISLTWGDPEVPREVLIEHLVTARPLARFVIETLVVVDAERVAIRSTATMRAGRGWKLQKLVHLCRFRDGRVVQARAHETLEAALRASDA